MESRTRRALEELCQKILAAPAGNLEAEIEQVRRLYEGLIVARYEAENRQALRKVPTPPSQSEKPSAERPAPPRPQAPATPPSKPSAGGLARKGIRREQPAGARKKPEEKANPAPSFPAQERKASLNDHLAKGSLEVGLNDRLAFIRHLFEGEQGDFQRVISQLNTIDNYREAEQFLRNQVKPDYNWSEKAEYEDRLLQLLRKRFGVEEPSGED